MHMEKHWEDIGFIPDRSTTIGEDVELDVDVQIGQDNIKNSVKCGPDLTQRYTAININGFSADVVITEIHKIFLDHGLPTSVTHDKLLRKEKTSRITVENLGPADCLRLMENMHGKKFLGKKIFITPIVSASPSKSTPGSGSRNTSLSAAPPAAPSGPTPPSSGAAHLEPPNPPPPPPPQLPTGSSSQTPTQLKLRSKKNQTPTTITVSSSPVGIEKPVAAVESSAYASSSGSGTDTDSEIGEVPENPVSPNILAKIGQLGQGYTPATFKKPVFSEKRKAEESPDKVDVTSLTKAEMKTLKKKNKRLKKQKHKEAERSILNSYGK